MAEPEPKKRFARVTKDVDDVVGDRVIQSTKATTKQWIRLLDQFTNDNEMNCDLDTTYRFKRIRVS